MIQQRNAVTAKTRPCRVMIVDDHPITRQGLGQLIDTVPDLDLCGEAESPTLALEVAAEQHPDVIVADLSFRGMDGFEMIKELRAKFPDVRILVLSIHDESYYAQRALKAGAMGYLMKHEPIERVIEGIRSVHQGHVFLSDRMSQVLLSRVGGGTAGPFGAEALTDREVEVLQLIGKGLSTRQVADQLGLSVKTIETHRENIKQKLKLENAAQLIQYAVRFAADAQ